jgi:hypothetical protein
MFRNVVMVVVVFQNIFYLGCIKIIFFIFKKLFLISAHQNDLKTPKNINLKQRKKNKINSNFFKNAFETQKQTGFTKLS